MEIPIQVAVRIAPTNLLEHAAAAKSVDNVGLQKNQEPKDANGNLHDFEVCAKTQCVVQAIPMSTNLATNQLDTGCIAGGLIQVGPHTFPVTHAMPPQTTQTQVYHQTVFPLISLFMEGFDASVVTYGESRTGKSYTLYGPGFDCVFSEADQGLVQRCVREIFANMANHAERTFAVNIGWVEICGEHIRDLLGVGNVHCNTVTDVFHWLKLGMNSRNSNTTCYAAKSAGLSFDDELDDEAYNNEVHFADRHKASKHTLFTLTLEQQWVSKEGLIQHRLSTASFSDLCGSERLFMLNSYDRPTSLHKDLGLQALEQVVNTLTDPALLYGVNGNIPYTQTTLTTLLKDSFGGRAQTLVIVCVSPWERDANETMCNLQFAFKVQCVRNYVIMNTFSDDNTPISQGIVMPKEMAKTAHANSDNFGLQFAASQWSKLVANAEGLFAKLMSSKAISELDKEQIEEWLFLKQECEDCLSSSEAINTQKQLVPIQEIEEPEETLSEPETSGQQHSDNESDSESQRPDLEEKLDTLMDELSLKTDYLVKDRYKEFLQKQPRAVMESQDQVMPTQEELPAEITLDERKTSISGRRRSIQPGASLSSAEIAMLNRAANTQTQIMPKVLHENEKGQFDAFIDEDDHYVQAKWAALNSPSEGIQKKIRKLDAEIDAKEQQIAEVEQTMQLKQNIITELVKNSETRSTAKQRFHKKKAKLEADYEKSKKQLAKALVQAKDKVEIERLHGFVGHLEQRLQDLISIKHIAGESAQKVKKLQASLHESKKLIEELHKKLRKERKLRDQLLNELRLIKEQSCLVHKNLLHSDEVRALPTANDNGATGSCGGGNLKEMQARLSHLDHVLREKSQNLQQYGTQADGTPEKEGLRHEIRNLRRTRDHLLEQRCSLDRKLKREKTLTQREERKLLECDEAIEAIDAAIEFKNELICGHRSIDTSEKMQREKGEQMLMARLNKLSEEEMRTLLYKYFTKVIDLRDSSRKLEIQLMQLERERDAWEWKERVLSNAVRQARLEGERNAVLLQRQHEMKLTLMLRHLADETSASSASLGSFNEQSAATPAQRYLQALAPVHTTSTASALLTSSYDAEECSSTLYKQHKSAKAQHKHGELEMCPLNGCSDALSKYKPLDKFKEKERDTKNKLFAKFQVLTRYAGQSTGSNMSAISEQSANVEGNRKKDKESAIPQENLKRLISNSPATKVIRQKNKIIIQDATRKN